MQDFKKLFPVTQSHTYLNTASSGLMSTSLAQWRKEHDQRFVTEGSIFRDHHKKLLDGVREKATRFFDTAPGEVALIPNFSFGLNTLLEGISGRKKVLLLDRDYPSINWAFEHRDFDVCYARVDEHLEQNIEQAVSRHRPDIFAFSMVQYLNGIKIDLNFLKQLKAYHPELMLIADGTQFLGTEHFSFTESPIDVLGASAYKWLLSGYGNGVFMIKHATQQQINPSTIGFNSADAIFGNREHIPCIKRFEPGHQDTLNYGSLGQSLQFLENVGIDAIASTLQVLTAKAKEAFIERGLLEETSAKREGQSTIFSIRGDETLFNTLRNNNVLCSQRGDGIRISLHIYNTEEDIHRLLSYC